MPPTTLALKNTRWYINDLIVNPGSAAEGLLVNVRMVNSVFEDTGPAASHLPPDFDPQTNTDRFIAAIPDYAAHGVNAFTISLQGGTPGYEGAVNSAFSADSSLRPRYLERVERVIQAAADHDLAIILSYFYQRQREHARAFATREDIHAAVRSATQWVVDRGFTNVAVEIANEYAHAGYRTWPDGEWLRSAEGQAELIGIARSIAPDLLITTSGMGSGTSADAIAEAGDFLIIHFNNTATSDIPARIATARAYGKPVVCNEDDKVGSTGAEAARLSIINGCGWGFMHSAKNQNAPFEFEGASDDPEVYAMLKQLTTPGASIDGSPTARTFIMITQPKDGDTFSPTDEIDIHVDVSGVVPGQRVQVLAGTNRIADLSSPPFKTTWPSPALGKQDLSAVLVDASGQQITRSRPVDIYIR